MTNFVLTPTELDLNSPVYRDPLTGQWILPLFTFNTNYQNSFLIERDPLNSDPKYHDRVIDNIHLRLTEKWLYKDPIYISLLKYFFIKTEKDKGVIYTVRDPDTAKLTIKKDDYRQVFKYIEKIFITRRFIEKVLREYVKTTHIKWYDLFTNISTLKELFAHKLKKTIIRTIYSLEKKNNP